MDWIPREATRQLTLCIYKTPILCLLFLYLGGIQKKRDGMEQGHENKGDPCRDRPEVF
jgi:hypothetical protein